MELASSFLDSTLIDDWLAILIGFSGIMLVLSLMVTTVAKIFENLFRFRRGILKIGVKTFIEEEINNKETANTLTNKILTKPFGDTGFWGIFEKYSRLSYVDADYVCNKIKEDPETKKSLKSLKEKFAHYEKMMTRIFTRRMRVVSVIVGFVIAFLFQVNTFDLLRQLSTDSEFREQSVAIAERHQELFDENEALINEDYSVISEQALKILGNKRTELKIPIEKTTGEDPEKGNIIGELMLNIELYADEAYLANQANSLVAIKLEFEELIDSLYFENTLKLMTQTKELSSELALVDLTIWKYGGQFYYNKGLDWGNLFGILITAIFLSFGTSFWNDILSSLLKIRDVLRPIKQNGKDKKNA